MAQLNNIHFWKRSVRTPDTTNSAGALDAIARAKANSTNIAAEGQLDIINMRGKQAQSKADKWGQWAKAVTVLGKGISNVYEVRESVKREEEHREEQRLATLQKIQKEAEEAEHKRRIEAEAIQRARDLRNRETAQELATRFQTDANATYYGTQNAEGDVVPGIQSKTYHPGDGEGIGSDSRQKSFVKYIEDWQAENLKDASSEVVEYFKRYTSKYTSQVIDDASNRDYVDSETYKAETHKNAIVQEVSNCFTLNPSWSVKGTYYYDMCISDLKDVAEKAIYEEARQNQLFLMADYEKAKAEGVEDLSYLIDWENSTFDNIVFKKTDEAKEKIEQMKNEFVGKQVSAMVAQNLASAITSDNDEDYKFWQEMCSSDSFQFTDEQKKMLGEYKEKCDIQREKYLETRTQEDGLACFSLLQDALLSVSEEGKTNYTTLTDIIINKIDSTIKRDEYATLEKRMLYPTKEIEQGYMSAANILASAVVAERLSTIESAYNVDTSVPENYDNARNKINNDMSTLNTRLSEINDRIMQEGDTLNNLAPYWAKAIANAEKLMNADATEVYNDLEYCCKNNSYLNSIGHEIGVDANKLHLDIEKAFTLGKIDLEQRTNLLRLASKKAKVTPEEQQAIDSFIMEKFNIKQKDYKKFCDILDKNNVTQINQIGTYIDVDDLTEKWETDMQRDDKDESIKLTTEVILAFRVAAMEYARSQDLHKRYPTITDYLEYLTKQQGQFIAFHNEQRIDFLKEVMYLNRSRALRSLGEQSDTVVFGNIEQEALETIKNKQNNNITEDK